MAHIADVHEMVEALLELAGRGLESAAVQECMLSTRIKAPTIEPYLHFDSTHYTRNLIHRCDAFELLTICWEPGQRAPIHDHENERCWALVHIGALRFTNFVLTSQEPLRLEQDGSGLAGQCGHLDALAGIHRVENATQERAVSIHLYARPFAECTIYDAERCTRERRSLRYDTLPPDMATR
jgi:cysteine dioxygenase